MASYLVIKNESTINRYLCEDTYNNTPYLKVSTNSTGGYLNLTTATTTGMRLNISNVTGNSTSMSTRESQYDETTGYSGISSRESTSGYSGISTSNATITTSTAYFYCSSTTAGVYSNATSDTNRTSITTSSYAYGGYMASSYTWTYSNRTTYFDFDTLNDYYSCGYNCIYYALESLQSSQSTYAAAVGNLLKRHCVTATYSSYSSNAYTYDNSTSTYMVPGRVSYQLSLDGNFSTYGQYTSFTLDANRRVGSRSITLNNDQDHIYHTREMTLGGATTLASSAKYTLSNTLYLYSTTNISNIGPGLSYNYSCEYSTINYYSDSSNVSDYTSSGMSEFTALSNETYSTSSNEIGNLSSTTALTRSSNYSTSSIDIGNLSSTTALTVTSSRSSA